MHVDQHKAYALVLFRGICSDEAEAPVGILRPTGPDLLAVDLPVVSGVLALRLKAREIGARTGLGIALTPAQLTAHDRRDVALLLRLGAVFQERRAEHRGAHAGHRIVGADAVHLLLQHARLGAGQAAAAIFGRPGRRAPALVGHPLFPQLAVGAQALGARDHLHWLVRQRLGEVGLEPLARLGAEGVLVGATEVGHLKFSLISYIFNTLDKS